MASVTLDHDTGAKPRLPGQPAAVGLLPDHRVDVLAAAADLLAGVSREPWGQLSPSVYETGRLVTLAPWLSGHRRRLEYLLAGQRPDGSWDGPDGYALVPTLSGAEALLGAALAGGGRHLGGGVKPAAERLSAAAGRALAALFDRLGGSRQLSIPDTPAVEIIVPALVAALNRHLDRLPESSLPGLDPWRGGARLPLPSGVDGRVLAAIEASLADGQPVATKLLHSLEVAGGAARDAAGVRVPPPGTVGASPAATAAWLGRPDRGQPALAYLEQVVGRYDGPVPSVIPITMFERAWVLNTLISAGLRPAVPAELPTSLAAAIGPTGTSGGGGLPPDADTTSVALLALSRLGYRQSLDCLWAFQTETHFVTWHGERTPSATTNAHVLDALTGGLATGADGQRAAAAAERVGRWLCEQQRADGTWTDKWHASAYYATACCTLALRRLTDASAAAAVSRATAWVLDTQRSDGSWGRWSGTAEETAYAIQMLLQAGVPGPERDRAVTLGYAYLVAVAGQPDRPPLWHDKDLYTPSAVVQSAVIAALHLAQREPSVLAGADRR